VKDLIKSITKSEWKFWAKVVIAVLILTSLSRIFLVIWTPDGFTPRGNIIYSFVDRHVYLSYIEQARDGKYLFEDLYTSKAESRPMLNLFWLALGLVARFTGLSANLTIEIFRIILAPLLLFILYLFLAFLIKNALQRKAAFLIAVLGGGMGLVFLPILYFIIVVFNLKGGRFLPIDIDNSEAFVFTTIYYSPHFIFSTFLFLSVILLSFLAVEKKKISYSIPAGLMSAVLLNFHPFTFFILFFILLAYFIFSLWKDGKTAAFLLKYFFIAGLLSLPSALYHLYMFNAPWWQNQIWRSTTVTPFWLSILAGYGILSIFAVYSLWLSFKKKIEIKNEKLLLCWLLSGAVLIFLPISVQGRFLEGYQIVLIILASYSLSLYLQKHRRLISGKIFTGILFIIFFCLSFVFVIYLDIHNIFLKGNLVYIKKETAIALKELKSRVSADELILADIYNANMIPGIAARRVFVGHGVETIDYKRKYDTLIEYMVSPSGDARQEILKQNSIDYVLYDSQWKDEWKWDPGEDDGLKKIYEKGGYKLYKVK